MQCLPIVHLLLWSIINRSGIIIMWKVRGYVLIYNNSFRIELWNMKKYKYVCT